MAIIERQLVAGECSYYACIPSKTLLRPGEALDAALAAPGAADAVHGGAEAIATLAWRDYMVSSYDDSAQGKWLADPGIELIRGSGRIVDRGLVEVDGRRCQARHIVIATGSEPVIPPIPGLAELDGVWTNREATGAREIPEERRSDRGDGSRPPPRAAPTRRGGRPSPGGRKTANPSRTAGRPGHGRRFWLRGEFRSLTELRSTRV